MNGRGWETADYVGGDGNGIFIFLALFFGALIIHVVVDTYRSNKGSKDDE